MSLRPAGKKREFAITNEHLDASYELVIEAVQWSGDASLAYHTATNATVLYTELAPAPLLCWGKGMKSIEIKLNRGGHTTVTHSVSTLSITLKHALTVRIHANGLNQVVRGGPPKVFTLQCDEATLGVGKQCTLRIDGNGDLHSMPEACLHKADSHLRRAAK